MGIEEWGSGEASLARQARRRRWLIRPRPRAWAVGGLVWVLFGVGSVDLVASGHLDQLPLVVLPIVGAVGCFRRSRRDRAKAAAAVETPTAR